MSQNDVVGLVPELHMLADAQPGLHYARCVLLLDQKVGAPLPPVGRGRAVAAAGGWRAHVGRATIIAGVSEYVQAELVLGDIRNAVVLLVRGDVEGVGQLVSSVAPSREVHLVDIGDAALRIIVSDAAQVVVQRLGTDGWTPLSTLLVPASAPQGRRTRPGKAEVAPAQPTAPVEPPVAPVAPVEIAEPVEALPQQAQSDVMEQLPEPPAVIEVQVVEPQPTVEQTEQVGTEQADKAEEN